MLRSSNRKRCLCVVAWLLCFSVPVLAQSQFKSRRDRLIAHDILQTFAKECVERGAADGEIVARIDGESQQAHHAKNLQVQHCFETNFSQISGVHYLYQKICDDVSKDGGRIPDTLAANQLVQVNKYQLGIRPYHSTLNDCLFSVDNHEGLPYIVPLSGLDLNAKVVQQQIESIRIKDPFPATLVPLR